MLSGDYAYLADEVRGLAIVDIRDPASSLLIGGYYEAPAMGVAVAGQLAFIAAGRATGQLAGAVAIFGSRRDLACRLRSAPQ